MASLEDLALEEWLQLVCVYEPGLGKYCDAIRHSCTHFQQFLARFTRRGFGGFRLLLPSFFEECKISIMAHRQIFERHLRELQENGLAFEDLEWVRKQLHGEAEYPADDGHPHRVCRPGVCDDGSGEEEACMLGQDSSTLHALVASDFSELPILQEEVSQSTALPRQAASLPGFATDMCQVLRHWISERPRMQNFVDVDSPDIDEAGCIAFPLRGMWSAEPHLDASPHGEELGDDGVALYHGFAATRLQSILSSTRLVRGDRPVSGKFGVCAAESLETALGYAPATHLTACAWDPWPVQCAFRLRVFRRMRVRQLKGNQYILRENWCQLEALVIRPWAQATPPRPTDFYTEADESEMPPNAPVQNWPFFCTWEAAPLDFTRLLEVQRQERGLVLEC